MVVEDNVGTLILRRYLGRRLRSLRTGAGLTQVKASEAAGLGRATLDRMEEGREGPRLQEPFLKALLDLYRADVKTSEELVALARAARNGRGKSWWHQYADSDLPEHFSLYVGLEASARRIRQYEVDVVPGLLQTRGYAEALHMLPPAGADLGRVHRRVEVRLARQELLHRPDGPRVEMILNEAAVCRMSGGGPVMVEQLGHLLQVGKLPQVSVRVLPLAVGLHAGVSAGASFTMMEFPQDPVTGEPFEPALAYQDFLAGAVYLNRPSEVAGYDLVWADLDQRALDEDASRNLLSTVMGEGS